MHMYMFCLNLPIVSNSLICINKLCYYSRRNKKKLFYAAWFRSMARHVSHTSSHNPWKLFGFGDVLIPSNPNWVKRWRHGVFTSQAAGSSLFFASPQALPSVAGSVVSQSNSRCAPATAKQNDCALTGKGINVSFANSASIDIRKFQLLSKELNQHFW